MDRCYGCGSGMDVVVVRAGEPLPQLPTILVYPSTSRGDIAFCDLCFEGRRFRDLSADDVERITWFFGVAYVESNPQRSIQLLEPMLTKWRALDLLSPLGRAYIGVGRIDEGRALLTEALSMNPTHPYSEGDRWLIEHMSG
jgi:hypothetical protein